MKVTFSPSLNFLMKALEPEQRTSSYTVESNQPVHNEPRNATWDRPLLLSSNPRTEAPSLTEKSNFLASTPKRLRKASPTIHLNLSKERAHQRLHPKAHTMDRTWSLAWRTIAKGMKTKTMIKEREIYEEEIRRK
jgi:hypothetical protein